MGFGYEGLGFCRNNGWFNGKNGQGTHSTKMGADKLTESTPNTPKFICPNCLPKPKSLVLWSNQLGCKTRTDW